MKICPVGTELLHANRRTEIHDEVNSPFFFQTFLKAPKLTVCTKDPKFKTSVATYQTARYHADTTAVTNDYLLQWETFEVIRAVLLLTQYSWEDSPTRWAQRSPTVCRSTLHSSWGSNSASRADFNCLILRVKALRPSETLKNYPTTKRRHPRNTWITISNFFRQIRVKILQPQL